MKTILKNKWHLHSLNGVVSLFLMNKLDLGDNTQNIIITLFLCLFIAVGIELCQGYFFGANKTPEQIEEAKLDVLAGMISSVIGIIFSLTINFNFVHLSLIWIGIVLILEVFRRWLIFKKRF